jgi:hypothetical protein
MKHIKSFKLFESYNDDLDFLNESKLYILPTFFKALSSAPSEFLGIVNDLRDLYGDETDQDITFVDIDNDTLSYSTMKNIEKEFPSLYKQAINWIPSSVLSDWSNDILESPTRGNIKIGKFVNKILKGKYPEALIDKFVTYIKSKSVKKENWNISLVKGDDIIKYYDSSNYVDIRGTLGHSCMSNKHIRYGPHHDDKNNIFDIYTKNPESCSLLIMTNEEGKLGARALVWDAKVTFCRDYKGDVSHMKKVKTLFISDVHLGTKKCQALGDIKFLDRIYTIDDWMVHKMTKWAQDNGMAIRYYQGLGDSDWIEYNGIKYQAEMEVNVKKIHYSAFPYLDTFNRYDVKSGKLLNYEPSKFSGFGLQSTSGNYGTVTGNTPRIRNYIRRFR